ncbi:GDSL-like Lipase/Acylhydrolase family protein [Actinokineospora alba]|uniref:GDSL-like Lipase/Acylhydrolase family protein n=1 Tax=Actinokineospora alba TaxID=504798 RepID=A0A1H0EZW8_9PSEU|nr:SGNH/GDSL hydrolase family protein [Actinokineospora alba]TDP69290.1 GDSL-like lipase/acylhydrolase family protein [Actinokineospora alba]SDI20090.1 GDSL-like Lipase/Acylhydrolase family protein [Actinokineospora alba]SDN87938.1 GDSL-like Lipase/Acylhydrolase family protein [Actinokineospora alba]
MSIVAALVLSLAVVPAPVVSEYVVSEYVALGDSYAAGVGSGGAQSGCGRSEFAHPNLWKDAHSPAAFAFPACSGATTRHVLDRQLKSLSGATELVTLTVGGMDADFTKVMTTCTLGSDHACEKSVARAEGLIRSELPGRFAQVFQAISAAAPKARVVVLGYPRLFEPRGCPGGLSPAKRAAVNNGADSLAEVTAAAAAATGGAVTFVDVREVFAGHGICGDDPWVHPVTTPLTDSYHPNRAGQLGYLRALESVVEGTVVGGTVAAETAMAGTAQRR